MPLNLGWPYTLLWSLEFDESDVVVLTLHLKWPYNVGFNSLKTLKLPLKDSELVILRIGDHAVKGIDLIWVLKFVEQLSSLVINHLALASDPSF